MEVKNENIYNLKTGDFFYKKNHDYKYHIVNIFKDNDLWLIIYKYYGKRKQWWHYEIKELWDFNDYIECGLYYFKNK